MKKYISIALAAAVLPLWLFASALLTSCVNDLDTLPLDRTEPVSEYVYGNSEAAYLEGLSKLYFQFVSNDLTDLQMTDGGASELIRAFWSVQETTADAVKCSWENDAWVRELNTDTWSEVQNDAVYAVYVRTLQGIAFVNEYLRQTDSRRLESRGVSAELAARIEGFRAEARFIRAYLYWMALDCFGNVPFTTENSPFGGAYFPKQESRTFIYDYCVSELVYLMSEDSPLPAARSNYPRADKGSAAGLLARMYLNSEVYTGTERWAAAKSVCENIFGMGYVLCPEYQDLFRGDNGENLLARGEMLWAVDYNDDRTQSYGGSSYILSATLASTDVTDGSMPNGQRNGWAGLRVPYEYVSRFFDVSGQNYETGSYDVTDKRGRMFYIKGREESMDGALYSFMNGWSCLKFNNIPHDRTEKEFLPVAQTKSFADVDFPMIRLGEIYLIYAEACMNLGVGNLAMPMIRELAERAGVGEDTDGSGSGRSVRGSVDGVPAVITPEFLMAERARELMWEGHRRTDLIRYGLYCSDSYLWPYKGGDSFAGQAFPEYKTIFPIPPTELAANNHLVQNPGYAVPTAVDGIVAAHVSVPVAAIVPIVVPPIPSQEK